MNLDGSFDSICKLCFVTIASSNLEEELAIAEAEHECNWRAFLRRIKPNFSVRRVVPTHVIAYGLLPEERHSDLLPSRTRKE